MTGTAYKIGVDIGGTFTDIVIISDHEIITAKVQSDKNNPQNSVLNGLNKLELKFIPDSFLHSTTLVTNMLLEHKGAKTAFITTQGMRDLLHIGRHNRPLNYAIAQEIVQQHYPPVPRKWRITVPERIDAKGNVIVSLKKDSIINAVKKLIAEGVESIAIGFLHSYRFNQHEELAKKWIEEEFPNLYVCTSNQVSPRFREYERFITTVLNAKTALNVRKYILDLSKEISKKWKNINLTLMTSNGGLEEVAPNNKELTGQIFNNPIRLALSGPAAAGSAFGKITKDLQLSNCIGLDIGGTSTDITIIRDKKLREAPNDESTIGQFPLQIPMLDLQTIGAGGGTIVYRDEYDILHIGPQSAGSDPGPACYDKNGCEPTVTDAAVVAGRIPEKLILGDELPIKSELSYWAIKQKFNIDNDNEARKLANEILKLTEANIAFAIRERTIARGINPNELAMIAAGGAGPMLACGVAEILELKEIIIPPYPGFLAAWGLLVAPKRNEFAISILKNLNMISPVELKELFRSVKEKLSAKRTQKSKLTYIASLRYAGQGFELNLNLDKPIGKQALEKMFVKAHEQEYDFSLANTDIEWLELRAVWESPTDEWKFPTKSVDVNPQQSTNIIHRDKLKLNQKITGPFIIVESDTTIFIAKGWNAILEKNSYIRIKKNEK